MLKRILWKTCVEWIELAQDRIQRRVLVNMAMNVRVPQKAGNFVIQLRNYQLLK
jgi:hypothetical protein